MDKIIIDLKNFGIECTKINRNISVNELIKISINNHEGIITDNGSLCVTTGKYTGRSPNDRYIVYDNNTSKNIHWGQTNQKLSPENFNKIFDKIKKFVRNKQLFVFDGFLGADKKNRISVRIINDHAWQNLFVNQLFIKPTQNELRTYTPEFTLMCINDFKTIPNLDQTNSDVFIIINLTQKIVLIGGTNYAGEIKKSMFSVMNYILPSKNIFPMHCSANVGHNGDTALFFGLSGTGKTTLSADPNRLLIGDDEHGWSENGIFNFEGGCYAKCIRLDKIAEPQIWNAIKHGTVLENVVVDKKTLTPNFNDNTLTENTRAAYPLNYIDGSILPSIGDNPRVIIFLTADALGVLPPISKLSKNSAMFHFMSGYTSKLAGTERGIKEPQAVFSECFGAPFMPRPAYIYAKMLGERITKYKTKVYLINTGWTSGPYGIGKRISIKYSRAMVAASLSGIINSSEYRHDELFNFDVPITCPNVPNNILNPKQTWSDKKSYDQTAKKLAKMFITNFAKFKNLSPDVTHAGPHIYE